MAKTQPLPDPQRRRKRVIIPLAVGIALLFGILLSQSSFDQPAFLNPDSNQQLLLFAALSALIFLLFVALTFVLARNLLKLFAERRMGVLGSKFRTRLVVTGLLLSFLPVIVMFWFAYGLMNRTIDRWFSRPVEEVREDTRAMAIPVGDLCPAERHRRGGLDREFPGHRALLRESTTLPISPTNSSNTQPLFKADLHLHC